MNDTLTVTGTISPRQRIYPAKAPDGKKYLFFRFHADDRLMTGKRGKPVKFQALCYATGPAWNDFRTGNIYPGKEVTIKGRFDPTLGDHYAFRVDQVSWEDLTKYLKAEPDPFTINQEF